MYSGKVDSVKEQQLQRLCSKVTSTVDLAGARVKVIVLLLPAAYVELCMLILLAIMFVLLIG